MKLCAYYIKLYATFISNTFSRETDYRFNFIGDLVDSLANFLVSIIFFEAIYANIDSIGGWSKYETLLLVGTAGIVSSIIYMLFMNNLPRIQRYIMDGDLDYILLKPCNELFYISFRYFYFGGITNAVPSVLLIIYSFTRLNIDISAYQAIAFAFFILCGVITSYSLWLIVMTFSFYFIKVGHLHELFLSSLKFIEYPGEIYKGVLRKTFTFIIPFLAIANLQVEFILSKITLKNSLNIVLISIVFLFLSIKFWKKSLKWYQSASS